MTKSNWTVDSIRISSVYPEASAVTAMSFSDEIIFTIPLRTKAWSSTNRIFIIEFLSAAELLT
jgi:hypothetical protein